MSKINIFFTLLLGAVVSFSSCSKDDELTPEELEAKEAKELLENITANFNTITSKEWAFQEFQPSADLLAASKTEDGVVAKTTMVKIEQVNNFGLVLSFEAAGDLFKTNVAMNVPEAEMEEKLIAYQDAIAGFPAGFLYDTKEYYMASVRRIIAAPFAADEAKIEEIVDESTGKCILEIGQRDFSNLSYDDLVLAQKKLIAGNSDKIYINEDGTLTVETTSEDYGVSKFILKEVK